jgi:hypothetical protein
LLILFIIGFSLNSVATPISYYTLSNAAFTAFRGNYQVFIEPKDIGEIAVFNCSARFSDCGLGFSNMDEGIERKNWASISYHVRKIPISIGLNAGIIKVYDNTDGLLDLGVWYRNRLSLGITYSNILNRGKILRAGISYTWKQFMAGVELEDSIRNQSLTPYGVIGIIQPVGDFCLKAYAGVSQHNLDVGLGIEFRDFINAMVFFTDTIKVLIGFNFRPPVITKTVTVVDTLIVKQPVIVEKTVIKKEPKPTPVKLLSKKDKQYCEEHYLKGIENYVNDHLEEAIVEWNLVTKVCSDYKDVKRYLENARAKLELLEE